MRPRSHSERAVVSAPVLRTFLNIADRWDLSAADQCAILNCDQRQLNEWSRTAHSHGPFVLETTVLIRISAVVGVFLELSQLLNSADEERRWLLQEHPRSPFSGRAPLDLLRGSLDDQLVVRLYAVGIGRGRVLPNEIDAELSPFTEQKIIWEDARPQIRAVCFDGFGTLVDIADKRRPFRTLLGDNPPSDLANKVLTQPTSLREVARAMSFAPDEDSIAALEAWLEAELASTRLREGIGALWEALRRIGLRVGVCSNLASPYGHALLGCLPRVPDALVLSFRFGKAKPQIEIYQQVCAEFHLEPRHVLFVGDRLEEDVLGPQRAGLFAMHIDEFETALAHGPTPAMPSATAELVEHLVEASREPYGSLSLSPEEALDAGLSHVNAMSMTGYLCRADAGVRRSRLWWRHSSADYSSAQLDGRPARGRSVEKSRDRLRRWQP